MSAVLYVAREAADPMQRKLGMYINESIHVFSFQAFITPRRRGTRTYIPARIVRSNACQRGTHECVCVHLVPFVSLANFRGSHNGANRSL